MSYASIVLFKDGKASDEIEYRNSHGGAPRIWSATYDRYMKDPTVSYDSWITVGMMCGNKEKERRWWALAKRQDLARFVRAVQAWTYDYVLVLRENFALFAEDLAAFLAEFPVEEGFVDHLPAWAELFGDLDADAAGLYASSVGENLWIRYDGEKDEMVNYDLGERSEHIDVYALLEEWNKGASDGTQ